MNIYLRMEPGNDHDLMEVRNVIGFQVSAMFDRDAYRVDCGGPVIIEMCREEVKGLIDGLSLAVKASTTQNN